MATKNNYVMSNYSTEDTVVGIDLGGTNIRAALITNGNVKKHYQCLVPVSGSIDAVLEALLTCVSEVISTDAKAIGVGVPGLVSQLTGEVYDIQNIGGWDSVDLKGLLETKFGLPVTIDNDANCFVLSEMYYGHAQGQSNVVGLALGTGMGAGVITNGHLHSGRDCGAGELGIIDYLDRDYESYCSGAFFNDKYQQGGELLYAKALNGDREALEAFAEIGKHIGAAIRMITYAFAPNMVVIGGSVARSHAFFAEAMHYDMQNNLRLGQLPQVRFSNSTQAAVMGAAALCFDKQEAADSVVHSVE